MKYSIFIEPEREEELIIYAHERTELVEKIERLILGDAPKLIGYNDGAVVVLDAQNIVCFNVENGKVYARTENKKYALKERLYTLEKRFPEFLKINQSCLVCTDKIKRFDNSIGGSITVTLEGGYRDYVSRRQLKLVKERIGF